MIELNGHRDDYWYRTQAEASADRAFAAGDDTEATKHRKIAMSILMKPIQGMQLVTSQGVERIAELTDDDAYATLGGEVDKLLLAGEENDMILAARWETPVKAARILVMGGNVSLEYEFSQRDAQAGMAVRAIADHVLLERGVDMIGNKATLLHVETAAAPDAMHATMPVVPPNRIIIAQVADITASLKKSQSPPVPFHIDWGARYNAMKHAKDTKPTA